MAGGGVVGVGVVVVEFTGVFSAKHNRFHLICEGCRRLSALHC